MDNLKVFIVLLIILGVVQFVFLDTAQYQGQDFPTQYLDPDSHLPTEADFHLYLDRLVRISSYFSERRNLNYTDANEAITAFLGSALLKRTLLDYGHKLPKYQMYIKGVINNMLNIVFHFVYSQMNRNTLGHKIATVLRDHSSHVQSLGTFRSGTLKKWLLRFAPTNDFLADMDRLTLKKEEYARLVDSRNGVYSITAFDSDHCLARLTYNMDPVNMNSLHPCKRDFYCRERIFVSPSVGYTLSHRMLNSMMYIHNRRCFHYSPKIDIRHIEMLCSHMYREAVYIARRGYFARAMFMEHLGLCGLMGYEEFHRRHWFRKITSWIDESGCMQEFRNFDINRTELLLSSATNTREVRRIKRHLDELLYQDCQNHPMSVAMLALSNGLRHAAHYLNDSVIDE